MLEASNQVHNTLEEGSLTMDNFSLGYSNSMYMAYGLNQAMAAGHTGLLTSAPADAAVDAYVGSVEAGEASAPVAEGQSSALSSEGGESAVSAALAIGLASVAAGILAGEGADGGCCDAE